MSQSHPHHDPTVPPRALIGAGVLIATALALTGATSLGLIPRAADPVALRAQHHVAPAEQRDLRFADRADGAVVITDAQTGDVITVIPSGQGGFVRAQMRRLAKARAAAGIGSQPPFRLTRWADGALSLTDPQTGKDAEIHGFGPDHSRTFADMLPGQGA
jgi:putative photosynthetic complex assembly protein